MNKLMILAKSKKSDENIELFENSYIEGFNDAFKMINRRLDDELKLLEKYPFHGERIMTLKIYKNKIQDMLKEMEKENV